jgi:hypothetical protein
VTGDFARYVRNPSPPARPLSGHGTETWAFDNRPVSTPLGNIEAFVGHQLAAVYNGTEVSAPGHHLLGDYQKVMRVPGLLIAVLLLLTPVGAIWGRGPQDGWEQHYLDPPATRASSAQSPPSPMTSATGSRPLFSSPAPGPWLATHSG